MNAQTSPREMSEAEKSQIQTAAFCAYIMHIKGIGQPEAMREMARLCMLTQFALFSRKV